MFLEGACSSAIEAGYLRGATLVYTHESSSLIRRRGTTMRGADKEVREYRPRYVMEAKI
jgi:hypothetical protein